MLRIDLLDQIIAHYSPKLQCRQTWMPIILHCLDVLHIDTHILHKEMCKRPEVEEKENGHKEFLLDFISLHIEKSIIKHNTQQPKKIQSTAVSAAIYPTYPVLD